MRSICHICEGVGFTMTYYGHAEQDPRRIPCQNCAQGLLHRRKLLRRRSAHSADYRQPWSIKKSPSRNQIGRNSHASSVRYLSLETKGVMDESFCK